MTTDRAKVAVGVAMVANAVVGTLSYIEQGVASGVRDANLVSKLSALYIELSVIYMQDAGEFDDTVRLFKDAAKALHQLAEHYESIFAEEHTLTETQFEDELTALLARQLDNRVYINVVNGMVPIVKEFGEDAILQHLPRIRDAVVVAVALHTRPKGDSHG